MSRKRPPPWPEENSTPEEGILDLVGLEPEVELETKRRIVEDALRARGIAAAVPAPVPSPRRWGARARIDLALDQAGRFVVHRPGTHEPMGAPLDDMALPGIAALARRIEACLGTAGAARPPMGRVALRSDGARVVVVVEPGRGGGSTEALLSVIAPALGPGDALCLGRRSLRGDPILRLDAGGVTLHIGPQSFFQVNHEVNRALVAAVTEAVVAWRPARVLDLFGGSGNLSFPIAARGVPVELVEAAAPSVDDARGNARRLGLPVEVRREDAYRLEAGSRFFDVAVLDPPRRGAGPALEAVCTTRPRGVALISCQPLALARDLQYALAQGYRLASLRLFDMFPLTSHVECLALLER
ncbi:MAG: RsmD family RNA methyltransferase [Pseudomonadota bacterium]